MIGILQLFVYNLFTRLEENMNPVKTGSISRSLTSLPAFFPSFLSLFSVSGPAQGSENSVGKRAEIEK